MRPDGCFYRVEIDRQFAILVVHYLLISQHLLYSSLCVSVRINWLNNGDSGIGLNLVFPYKVALLL